MTESKMLTLTMRDIVNMEAHLVEVGRLTKMPFKTSYRLARMMTHIKPELATFSSKRDDLIRLYGSATEENPENFAVEPNKVEEFQTAINEFLSESIEVMPWHPITPTEFGEAAASITPLQLAAMFPLLAPVVPENAATFNLTLKMLTEMEAAIGAVARLTDMPIETSYRLAHLVATIQPALEKLPRDRAELVRKFGVKIEGTEDQYNILNHVVPDFNEALEEMLETVVPINNWAPLSLNSFGEKAELNITAVQIAALMPLLDLNNEE